MSIIKACLFLWRFAPVICQALTLNGFQTPNCGTFFFSPSPENVTSAFVWLDYPLAAPIIGGYVPDGAFKEAVSDPGSWCNPALWWPLSAEETRSRGLILVTTEMGVSGCQYFGNSNSIFYNARNLGFKAFVLLSVASGYTCSTGLVFNSSFPSAAYKERMSVCSDTPLYIVPTAAGNRYNQQYDTVGYLALLVPSFLEILRGAAASFPTLTVAPYECDVTKVANSPGMFVFTFFLLLFRAIIFVKAVLTLHTLARLRRPVAWLGVLFAGVLTGVASAFEIMGNPVDLPGINYWPVFGQKDQVIVVYLPMCLSLCSNIAFMWLWLKVGLNLRSLMHSKWYDGIGIVLACIPLPILIPFMSSGTFDLYSYETSLIRVVVDQVLAGKGLQDLIKLADDASQERAEVYRSLNDIVFYFSLAITTMFTLVQVVALHRIRTASQMAKTRKAYQTLRRLVALVLVQTLCLISEAILVYFSQDLAWDIILNDQVAPLIGFNYIRIAVGCIRALVQVIAFSSAASSAAMPSSLTKSPDADMRDSSCASARLSSTPWYKRPSALRNSVLHGFRQNSKRQDAKPYPEGDLQNTPAESNPNRP